MRQSGREARADSRSTGGAGLPLVSIIIATYHRPEVLQFAIRSVLRQTEEDWELIVVGDGCTDDTEAVVRAFGEPRIRFFNLPANSGGQAAPNNLGMAQARGRWLFFLNHDDLYFDNHLAKSIEFLEQSQADISWSPVLLLHRSGRDEGVPDPLLDALDLDGVSRDGRFDPNEFIIASSWAMRRTAAARIGPWLPHNRTRLSPSQEWLFRAHRKGAVMAYHPYASVLCIHAGVRRGAYLLRRSVEHERAWTWVTAGETGRQALLTCVEADRMPDDKGRRPSDRPTRPVGWRATVVAWLSRLGFHPVAVRRFLDGEGRGDWIASVRKHTGSAFGLAAGRTVQLGDVEADAFLGTGWQSQEPNGRWTGGALAHILFEADRPGVLQLCGHGLRSAETVQFMVGGILVLEQRIDARETVVRLPVEPGLNAVSIRTEAPATPKALGGGDDTRVLGYFLAWLRFSDV